VHNPADNFYPGCYLAPINKFREDNILSKKRTSCEQIKIGLMPDRYKDGSITPCGYIRLVLPLDFYGKINKNITVEIIDKKTRVDLYDAIICQRHVVDNINEGLELLIRCKKSRTKIIYDIDDDLVNIPSYHIESQKLNALTSIVTMFLKESDLVTVSTNKLKKIIKDYTRNSIVIPNFLDNRIWFRDKKKSTSKRLRCIYMGTATHDTELEFLRPIASEITKKYSGDIFFELVGITNLDCLMPFTKVIPKGNIVHTYPGFVNWLLKNKWDIAFAPLVDNEFNSCKSAIKLMDYSALNIPIIASPNSEYLSSFPENSGIQYVENNVAKWVDKIDCLIANTNLRNTLSEMSNRHFQKYHTLQTNHQIYSQIIQNISK
jgi:glycosyltransferase involved in cell wall biosynthesis